MWLSFFPAARYEEFSKQLHLLQQASHIQRKIYYAILNLHITRMQDYRFCKLVFIFSDKSSD